MFSLKLNGKEVSHDEDVNLLVYLREHAGIVSAKDGCSQGACGTCMVLIDGKATRACIAKLSKLEGKEVVTIEGFSEREREVFAYTFAEAGAVQCGFCIPGMVVSAKALIESNPDPSRAEVKKAIRGNICRCTGYVKIEDAILLAAKMFRENTPVPEDNAIGKIGEQVARPDAHAKALGEAQYVDDMRFDDMVYGRAVRSKFPRAKVLGINTEKAKAHPEAIGVFTADDIDGSYFIGHLKKDQTSMVRVGDITRYAGDAVALVLANTQKAAAEMIALVEVEYEELTPMLTPEEALAEGAPAIHEGGNLLTHEVRKRGDVEAAIAGAKYVVTEHYSTPHQEHAFLEPEAAVAMPKGDDGVLVYSGGQSVYDELNEISELLGIPKEKVHIRGGYVGGGFGGKEDMSVQHHAAFLAYKTKRTVKVIMSRDESLLTHPKRHPAEMTFTSACDENGKLVALKAEIITDTGSYASLGGPVLQRACTHAAGPYNYQNILIDGKAVYTNNPPCGAFRGFGVTQSAFAMEANLNKLAELVGISPWEIRHINAVRPGESLPNGQIADEGTAIVETLEAVKEDYDRLLATEGVHVGIACSMKNAGLGVGVPDPGRTHVKYEDDDKLHVYCSAADIGQGLLMVLMQVAAEASGFPKNKIVVSLPDTETTPDGGTTTASRQTAINGESCRRACTEFKKALDASSLEEVRNELFIGEYWPETDRMGSDKPNPVSHISYGYATQLVAIDEEGKLSEVIAAHDVGRAISPKGVEGQIEGGVMMGLGYALTETLGMAGGKPTKKFGTMGLFRADQAPPIKSIIIGKNAYELEGYGAKGVGEITCCPPAPAVQNAYYKKDGIFRTTLPLKDTFYNKKK